MVRPAEEDECLEDAWQGTINKMSALTKKLLRTLEIELQRAINKQQADIIATLKVSEPEVLSLRSTVRKIRNEVVEMPNIKAACASINADILRHREVNQEGVKSVKKVVR